MHIQEIKLKNFKGFKELAFDCNDKFNVIIGENNIGKSTIFEALLIWESCFKRIINSKRTGFYKADGGNTYIPFGDLTFIRLINDTDLFFDTPNQARITVVIAKGTNQFSLTFELSKPKSINNSYLRFKTVNHKEFEKFAVYLKANQIKLDEVIFIYQTKPVSNILSKEPFMNKGQVLKKISLGKSGEVLRNKIIQKKLDKRKNLETQISKVLGNNIKFICSNESKSNVEEYINLKVSSAHRNLDIHLQGSGFLQVAEIFSTIDYLENAINILLIDEPDSHIHAKLQKKLLQELRQISNTQIFVISHNDNFVSELKPKELFYLNQEAKTQGRIQKLSIENFDKIKKELGGIIIALDKLNYTDKICFVEGDDDIQYIKSLLQKHLEFEPENLPKCEIVFYYLRGKDYIINKLDYNKRLLSQLFKDKRYFVIFDKDFSTLTSSAGFEDSMKAKLGGTSATFKHDGYCIESTLFGETDKLVDFLSDYYNIPKLKVNYFVLDYFDTILNDIKVHTSNLYQDFENKFKGQKKESRPELHPVEYNDFLREALTPGNVKIAYLFNKHLIASFIKDIEKYFDLSFIYSDDSDEFYASNIFNKYIEWIKSVDDFLLDSIHLLKELYEIN
ncbi:AAA family ATPase [Maribellus sp. YY47]|uniref:ATP-dependent nuclease n=1 Tax=Maribellus sp. YY47 TaxID=2929486 RepID=UPI0020013C5F|nr:AAA family ATPase [Maribellus sp. YY47]